MVLSEPRKTPRLHGTDGGCRPKGSPGTETEFRMLYSLPPQTAGGLRKEKVKRTGCGGGGGVRTRVWLGAPPAPGGGAQLLAARGSRPGSARPAPSAPPSLRGTLRTTGQGGPATLRLRQRGDLLRSSGYIVMSRRRWTEKDAREARHTRLLTLPGDTRVGVGSTRLGSAEPHRPPGLTWLRSLRNPATRGDLSSGEEGSEDACDEPRRLGGSEGRILTTVSRITPASCEAAVWRVRRILTGHTCGAGDYRPPFRRCGLGGAERCGPWPSRTTCE